MHIHAFHCGLCDDVEADTWLQGNAKVQRVVAILRGHQFMERYQAEINARDERMKESKRLGSVTACLLLCPRAAVQAHKVVTAVCMQKSICRSSGRGWPHLCLMRSHAAKHACMNALACVIRNTSRDNSNAISKTSTHMCLASLLVMDCVSMLNLCEATVYVCAPINVDGCLRCCVIMLCGHLGLTP